MRFALNLFYFVSLTSALWIPVSAWATKVDLGAAKFSTFVGGSFGTSKLGDSAYGTSSGSGTLTDKQVPWSSSGDVGFVLPFGRFNVVMGAELLMPRYLSDIKGTNSSGTSLFNLESKASAFIPMVNLEILAFKSAGSRTLLGLGGGYALVFLENNYVMTAAGKTALNANDYSEKGSGTATLLQAYIAEEFTITDDASLVLSIGYRNCVVQSLASSNDVTAIVGQENSSTPLINGNGGQRTLDLSGGFAGLALRFYLGH